MNLVKQALVYILYCRGTLYFQNHSTIFTTIEKVQELLTLEIVKYLLSQQETFQFPLEFESRGLKDQTSNQTSQFNSIEKQNNKF